MDKSTTKRCFSEDKEAKEKVGSSSKASKASGSKGQSKAYKREVICPKCDLKVSSYSTDVVSCRKCGLRYMFPYCKRPFEPKPDKGKLFAWRKFRMVQCLDCRSTRVVYVYPGEIVKCISKGCHGDMIPERDAISKN